MNGLNDMYMCEKRYIFFVGTLGNGGAERVISILSNLMAQKGMNVEVLTYYDRPVFYDMNPNVKVTAVETNSGSKNKIENLFWIRNYFMKYAKIVISFLAPFNIMAIAANMGTGIPIIVADRNDPTRVPTNVLVRKIRNLMYMFSDAVVVQTEKNKAYFNSHIRKKTTVIYNPVDMKEESESAIYNKKEKNIVSAGRLMEQKNQKMMICAFAEIAKKHPEYKLILYGEGPCRDKLQDYIQQLGLCEKVLLPGSTTELHEKIKSAEIFVLSSDYEGMPNALIEAMCLGMPVISTKVSGATDLIEDKKNGLLVEVGAVKELVLAIEMLISDEKARHQMACKAAELKEKLLPEQILEQWLKLIRSYI